MHEKLNFTYKIDFNQQMCLWLDNIMSEVHFWTRDVAQENSRFHQDYVARIENIYFNRYNDKNLSELEKYLTKIDVPLVCDIGCGLAPKYGHVLSNAKEIKLERIDPLSHFYNIINKKYAPQYADTCRFGLFEFISCFKERESYDAIIISNALDHCIDPYKSILESLYTLKEGGILYLVHGRAEAVNAKYTGLHQWNIDYNEKKDFIIWNLENSINVTKSLSDIADITLFHTPEDLDRDLQYVIVYITKKSKFDLDLYIEKETEQKQLANMIDKLMKFIACPDINKIFNEYLNLQH